MDKNRANAKTGDVGMVQSVWIKIIQGLAFIVALWLLVEVFHISFDCFSRYIFNQPFPGTMTISIVMLMFLVYLGAPYCEHARSHIRVDILVRRFRRSWKHLLDVLWLVLALSLMPLLIWQTFLLALDSWRIGEMAMDIALPMYPGKFVIAIGFTLWAIQIVFSLIDKIKGGAN